MTDWSPIGVPFLIVTAVALPPDLAVLVGSFFMDPLSFFLMHRNMGSNEIPVEHAANHLEHAWAHGDTQKALERAARWGDPDITAVLLGRVERRGELQGRLSECCHNERGSEPSLERLDRLVAMVCCKPSAGCRSDWMLGKCCGCQLRTPGMSPFCMGGLSLHLAVTHGHLDVVRLLVKRLRHPPMMCSQHGLAMVTAAKAGHTDLLNFLMSSFSAKLGIVSNGVTTTAQYSHYLMMLCEVLRQAVFGAHVDIVKGVLRILPVLPTLQLVAGKTNFVLEMMEEALSRGHDEIVGLLSAAYLPPVFP